MATSTEIQDLIKLELSVGTDSVFDTSMPTWWSIYADKNDLQLQYLYVRRHAILYLLGKNRNKVDVVIGNDEVKNAQKFSHLLDLLKITLRELAVFDPVSSATYLNSVSPCSPLPDSIQETFNWLNSSGYLGDMGVKVI